MTRRGMTLWELLCAGVLLAVLMTVCLQMLSAAATQRRAAEDRQTAICEAANVMERLSGVPFDALTPDDLPDVQLCDEARQALSGAEVEIELDSPAEQPDAKRVTVLLRWQDPTGRPARPVRLVAWRYRGI